MVLTTINELSVFTLIYIHSFWLSGLSESWISWSILELEDRLWINTILTGHNVFRLQDGPVQVWDFFPGWVPGPVWFLLYVNDLYSSVCVQYCRWHNNQTLSTSAADILQQKAFTQVNCISQYFMGNNLLSLLFVIVQLLI